MKRGFSMIEMMVALMIGALLVLVAASFASHQVSAASETNQHLDMTQMGRRAIDLLASDLTNAGVGVGYRENGDFAGLEVGPFTHPGGAAFNSNNFPIVLLGGPTTTDDISILLADAEFATIADHRSANNIFVCSPSSFKVSNLLILHTEDGISARSVRVTGVSPNVLCGPAADCLSNCDSINFAIDTSYLSGASATTELYSNGEAAGGFRRLTYFIDSDGQTGRLRRARGSCVVRNNTCGDVIVDEAESLQMRVYSYTAGAWVDRSTGGPITSVDPLRVDFELVTRTRTPHDTRPFQPVRMVLENNTCLPEATCATRDKYYRAVTRGSAYIKNAGKMRFVAGG